MELYARVNILDGIAVRLPRGDLREAIALDPDPLHRARHWVEQGADRIHVVDLNAAAYGDYVNRPLIDRIISELDVPVQVAGGIRSHVEAARLIDRGAWRIVMGTAAIEDQNMVWDLCRDYPGKVAISLDVRPDEEIATRGWTKNSGRYLEEVLIEMSSAGAAAFLIAEAGRDALTEPPDYRILVEALTIVSEPVIAAGGVRNLDDLRTLVGLEANGRRLAGVIVGREVTSGRFSIEDAKKVLAEPPATRPVSVDELPTTSRRAPTRAPYLEELADGYERLADECEKAAAAASAAGQAAEEGRPDQAAAHAFRARGHLDRASDLLDDLARIFAEGSPGH
jgi:phosphoribosylformimino-5-aminoimidazole carboxamide ribotide isomerase